MKRHTMVKELKSFLERVSYIRKITPRPALVISGLSKLLKRENVFIWGAEHPIIKLQQESFAYLMALQLKTHRAKLGYEISSQGKNDSCYIFST
nr:hypothetical protein CFP56_66259 [Quercus suber]